MAGSDVSAPPTLAVEPLMSIEEVAGVLRISERGLYRLIRSGELVILKVGHRTLLEPAEVRNFITNHRQAGDLPPRQERAA